VLLRRRHSKARPRMLETRIHTARLRQKSRGANDGASSTMRICVRAIDAGMRQLLRGETAALVHVEAVELASMNCMNSSFDTTPFLSWSIKRIRFCTSRDPVDQVRLLTATAEVDAITAATSPEISAIFEIFAMSVPPNVMFIYLRAERPRTAAFIRARYIVSERKSISSVAVGASLKYRQAIQVGAPATDWAVFWMGRKAA